MHGTDEVWALDLEFSEYGSVPMLFPGGCRPLVYNFIDYRCADGRFLTSPSGMAISNTRYLPSSETRVNAGIRAWKSGMSIKNRYPVPKMTSIAGIGTGSGAGTQLLVVPVPDTKKTINFESSVPVLPKYQNR